VDAEGTSASVVWEQTMTWAKWIFAYLFDCVHVNTTWPQRGRTGTDYVCCVECGREFPYSTQLMRIVGKEAQLEDRSQYQLGGAREYQIRTHGAI
jgi:hypothetical protein